LFTTQRISNRTSRLAIVLPSVASIVSRYGPGLSVEMKDLDAALERRRLLRGQDRAGGENGTNTTRS